MRGRMDDGREGEILSLSDFGWGRIRLDDGEEVSFSEMDGPEVLPEGEPVPDPSVDLRLLEQQLRRLADRGAGPKVQGAVVVTASMLREFADRLGRALDAREVGDG